MGDAIIADGIAGDAELCGDFPVVLSLAQEGLDLGFFSVEDGFFGAFAGTFGSAEGHAFFSLHLHHSCEALCLHLTFDGNYFAEMVNEERHRAVGVELAG